MSSWVNIGTDTIIMVDVLNEVCKTSDSVGTITGSYRLQSYDGEAGA